MAVQSPGQAGSESYGLIAFGGILLFIVAGWFIAKDAIVQAAWWLMSAEAAVVSTVSGIMPESTLAELIAWRQLLAEGPPVDVPIAKLGEVLAYAGAWIRWPVFLCLLIVGIYVFRATAVTRFRRVMDLEALLADHRRQFPRVRPVANLRADQDEEQRGPYTRALTPYEWARSTGVLQKNSTDLDDNIAREAFERQLGAPWCGVDRLKLHEKIVMAILCGRIVDQEDKANRLLDAVAEGFEIKLDRLEHPSLALTKKDRALIDLLLQKAESRPVKDVVQRHGYVRVILSELLALARANSGILASSDWLWIKAIDRTLHYALNQVGRPVAWSEAAAVRAHLEAEREAGESLKEPHVNMAITALRDELENSGYEASPLWDEAMDNMLQEVGDDAQIAVSSDITMAPTEKGQVMLALTMVEGTLVEVAIADIDTGDMLFHTLVYPETVPSDTLLEDVGLTPHALRAAPRLTDRWSEIESTLTGRRIVAFDADTVLETLAGAARSTGRKVSFDSLPRSCVRRMFAGVSKDPSELAVVANHWGVEWSGFYGRAANDLHVLLEVWPRLAELINRAYAINDRVEEVTKWT